jgi:hypothetical protein
MVDAALLAAQHCWVGHLRLHVGALSLHLPGCILLVGATLLLSCVPCRDPLNADISNFSYVRALQGVVLAFILVGTLAYLYLMAAPVGWAANHEL